MIRRTARATIAGVALALALSSCSSSSTPEQEKSSSETVNLTFKSLAWQPESIKANKAIVAAWNSSHPKIQVKYVQGDWGTIGDQLTTEFQAGKAPDLFHFYDGGLQEYAKRGDLLDLTKYLTKGFRSDIRPAAWENVSFDAAKGTWGVPFLQEPLLVYGNVKLLKEKGITAPSADSPWTWDQFMAAAKQLTVDKNGDGKPEVYGAAMPLKDGGVDNTVILGMSFGAKYFSDDGKTAQWGKAEAEVPARFHQMIYTDHSMSKNVLGLGSTDVIPPFLAGKVAMIIGGTFIRQQLAGAEAKGFQWVAIPPLEGTSQNLSNGAQTISVSRQTKHPKEAVQFLEYLLNGPNQAKLALGDWETPTSIKAGEQPALSTDKNGWNVAIAATADLVQGEYQRVAAYGEWSSKVANAAFAKYYANKISLDELGRTLVDKGNPVLAQSAR